MSATALARTIVSTLVAEGVRHAVVAPGSRNAPLSLALAAADARGEMRLHVRIDERSAGFVALGLARATSQPVAVVTTSGTAVGNLVPAVMEARHSALPLVVLSADRPASMINSGANQTTGQAGIFAGHALDIACVSSESGTPQSWRHALRRSLALARGTRTRQPGPVHLNVQLAAPLVDPELLQPLETLPALRLEPSRPSSPVRVDAGPRTVVLAGDAPPEAGLAAAGFAEALRVPLLAEPSSNARSGATAIASYRLLLADLGERIQRVVVFGHPTLSRPVSALLARGDCDLVMVAPQAEWIDPGHAVTSVVDAVVAGQPDDGTWLDEWRVADQAAQERLDAQARAEGEGRVDGQGRSVGSPRAMTCALWGSLGSEDLVVLGSSNVIRDADLAPIRAEGPVVYANRGLAGIDGTIASAIGVAVGAGHPVTAVMGDLTFLHDISSLVFGDLEARPDLRIVVMDDHGGSIFHGLEQGADQYATHFERVFGTPQAVDLARAARGFVDHVTEVGTPDELRRALGQPVRGVEVMVARVSRRERPRSVK